MKFRTNKARREYERWHLWFAWYPVEVDYGDWRWLQHVERKGIPRLFYGWMWSYRDIQDEHSKVED